MDILALNKTGYSIDVDLETGRIISLRDKKNTNWISSKLGDRFGEIFVSGTQEMEHKLELKVVEIKENKVVRQSLSKASQLIYELEENYLRIKANIPRNVGPRSGLDMDVNLLDTDLETWGKQCMPVVIYTDPNQEYAYFVFESMDKGYMVLTINSPFAAWRIKYSYEGHKMIGFQILSEATDVAREDGKRLQSVEEIELRLCFADSIGECFEKIASILKVGIAQYPVSGGVIGNKIPIHVIGETTQVELVDEEQKISYLETDKDEVLLEQVGEYKIITTSPTGRKHMSSIRCIDKWETLFDKINTFYANNFQHDSGAMYRVIWKDGLSPKGGRTFEGVEFGNPKAFVSCRTGEFGGFAIHAMMKNCILFGQKPKMMKAIERYVYNWALNKGHEEEPFIGTVCKKELNFNDRDYSPYHLYKEYNYPQHEAFLLQQLVDFYTLTKDTGVLMDAIALANHFINDHMREGMVICQNTKEGEEVDYTTVSTILNPFIELIKVLRIEENQACQWICENAEKMADHICKRGLSFPTEGEPCTEDGSMACSVSSLLLAYKWIKGKPEYLKVAKEILAKHEVLVMKGMDCRMYQSSIRFWETQYETSERGPSINAGHGWSIWTAEAKALLAEIESDIDLLKQAYSGFITNVCKVDDNGGMYSCYTPDMIPGTPHKCELFTELGNVKGDLSDLRVTTTILGMNYPKSVYAASGNYFLIKAAEIWNEISGVSFKQNIAINCVVKGNVIYSEAKQFRHLILDEVPEAGISIKARVHQQLRIGIKRVQEYLIEGARVIGIENGIIELQVDEEHVKVIKNTK